MLMSFMSCSIIVAWHENRDPSSIASGEHSPNSNQHQNIFPLPEVPCSLEYLIMVTIFLGLGGPFSLKIATIPITEAKNYRKAQ